MTAPAAADMDKDADVVGRVDGRARRRVKRQPGHRRDPSRSGQQPRRAGPAATPQPPPRRCAPAPQSHPAAASLPPARVRRSGAVDKSAARLSEAFRAAWLPKVTAGWFFRAETYFSVARYLDGEFNRAQMNEALDKSLARLRTDFIDLVPAPLAGSRGALGRHPTVYRQGDHTGPENPILGDPRRPRRVRGGRKVSHVGLSNESA